MKSSCWEPPPSADQFTAYVPLTDGHVLHGAAGVHPDTVSTMKKNDHA